MTIQSGQELYWEMEVKSLNRYNITDAAIIAGISLLLCLVMIGFIFLLEPDMEKPWILLMILGVMTSTIVFIFLFALLLIRLTLGSVYQTAYILNDEAAFLLRQEKGQDKVNTSLAVGAALGAVQSGPWMAGLLEKYEKNKTLPWSSVTRASYNRSTLVITLFRKLIPAMRLYCPDETVFDKAASLIQVNLSLDHSNPPTPKQ